MTGMMNWYRANFGVAGKVAAAGIVEPETLILWGEEDHFLEKSMAELSGRYCRRAELLLLPEVSHWIQHEAAAQVNQRLLTYMS